MNREFIAKRNFIVFITSLIMVVFICWLPSLGPNSAFIFDGQDYIIGRDFFNVWGGAVGLPKGDPQLIYDNIVHNNRLREMVGMDYRPQKFSYPPHVLLLLYPFSLMPYNLALLSFTAIGLCAFWFTAMQTLDYRQSRWALWLAPATILCLLAGQYSLVMAAIFITLYRRMDSKPILCGILIALLTIKPQIGVLLPIFLLVTGRYKVFAVATIASAVFVGLSVYLHGIDIWHTYYESSREQLELTKELGPFSLGFMPTVTVQLGLIGLPLATATGIHGIMALGLASFMIYVCLKTDDRFMQFAVFVMATFMITPYLMIYDTVLIVWLLIMLIHRTHLKWWHVVTYVWIMVMPFVGPFLTGFTGINAVWGLLAMTVWVYIMARDVIREKTSALNTTA